MTSSTPVMQTAGVQQQQSSAAKVPAAAGSSQQQQQHPAAAQQQQHFTIHPQQSSLRTSSGDIAPPQPPQATYYIAPSPLHYAPTSTATPAQPGDWSLPQQQQHQPQQLPLAVMASPQMFQGSQGTAGAPGNRQAAASFQYGPLPGSQLILMPQNFMAPHAGQQMFTGPLMATNHHHTSSAVTVTSATPSVSAHPITAASPNPQQMQMHQPRSQQPTPAPQQQTAQPAVSAGQQVFVPISMPTAAPTTAAVPQRTLSQSPQPAQQQQAPPSAGQQQQQ